MVDIAESARRIELKAPPRLPDRIDPRRHKGESPRFWVRTYLVLICLLVLVGMLSGLWFWQMQQRHGEFVPDLPEIPHTKLYRIDRPVTAFDVLRDDTGNGTGLLVADDRALHHGKQVKELLYWQRVPLEAFADRLPGTRIAGLTSDRDRAGLVCETEENGRRAVTASWAWPSSVTTWPQPIIDPSYFPGIEDAQAHCVLTDVRSQLRLVGGGSGIGMYDPHSRRWTASIPAASNALKLSEVYDLDFLPDGRLAVLGEGGIDCGTLTGTKWTPATHYDRASGLVGDKVRHGHMAGENLMYVTASGGLGRVRLNKGDAKPEALVNEGAAPGLTRAALKLAAEDRKNGYVWMVHEAAGNTSSFAAAAYHAVTHQMAGLVSEQTWTSSEKLALVADPEAAAPAAWVGGTGLRQIQWSKAKNAATELIVASSDLNDRLVDDIALNRHAVVAHAVYQDTDDPALSNHVVEAATRKSIQAGDGAAWSEPYIGRQRFPNLALSDLSAAAAGSYKGHPAVYFGTKSKGIAAFLPSSREFILAHHSKHPDAAFQVPHDGSIDLAAVGDLLVQVSKDRTVAFQQEGVAWQSLIPAGGIDIDPADVITVVAEGTRLVLGTANRIGYYDATTHRWASLPTLDDLERLHLGLDALWAIDKNRQLFSLPLNDFSASKWSKEGDDIQDFYGDSSVVAALGGSRSKPFLWIQQKGKDRIGLRPNPLPNKGSPWAVAAADSGHLYVAPHNTPDGVAGIGAFDLAAHSWKAISYPQEQKEAPSRLLTTTTGLWMIGSKNTLFFTAKESTEWHQAANDVKWISSDGNDVIVIDRVGQVRRSTKGALPMTLLVGAAFAGELNQVVAAAAFQDNLFVGTSERIGRYEQAHHDWHNYEGTPGAVQFAATTGYLYARTKDGHILRWAAESDTWDKVGGGEKSEVVKQIVADGPVLYFRHETQQKTEAVSTLSDSAPDSPKVLIAATRREGGEITAAAEVDTELFLGDSDGRVAAYLKAADSPRMWKPIINGPPSASVRQILAHPSATNALAVVGDQVWLIARDDQGKPWAAQSLMQKNVKQGAVGPNDFYGLAESDDKELNLYHAPLSPNADVDSYFGARFPVGENPATLAAEIGPSTELFRADVAGNVAMYSMDKHAWDPKNIKGVRQFFRIADQLWAWAPKEKKLYRWSQETWQVGDEDSDIEQVVSDGKELLIAKGNGSVKLRQATGDVQVLAPRPAEPLNATGINDIRALAEVGNRLLLAVHDHPLLAYDRSQHTWQTNGPVSVVNMVVVGPPGADDGVVFAHAAAGTLHRYDAANGAWSAVEIPEGAKVARLSAADTLALVRTDDGAIHFIDQNAKLLGSLAPKFITKRTAADFQLRAVTELEGKLLVVPELGEEAGELWRYDPDSHRWHVETINVTGQPRYFLNAPAPWLVCQDAGGLNHLYRIGSGEPMVDLRTSINDLIDVAGDGKSLWVITKNHHIQKVGADGKLESVGVPDPALPAGRTVYRAFTAAGDQCGVLLDDGSVHHYDAAKHKWIKRIPALGEASASKGTLVRDESRRLLLVRPQEEVWVCDMATGEWKQLSGGENIAELPPVPKDIPASGWQVSGKSTEYEYAVNVDGKFQKRTLVEGRFDWDLPRRLAVKDETLWFDTDGGARAYKWAGGEWQEAAGGQKQFSKPEIDPLKLEGTRFLARRDDQAGAFRVANGKVSLSLKVGELSIALHPGSNEQGAGFGHDVIRDGVAAGKDFWMATADGAVRYQGLPQPKLLEKVGSGEGLPESSLDVIHKNEESLTARTATGRYASLQAGNKWQEIDADRGAAVFREAQSILRFNERLRNWELSLENEQLQLNLLFNNVKAPVNLGPRGFGFDQPQAFSLAESRVRLWSVDGLVELDRSQNPMQMVAMQHALRLPIFTGMADLMDDPKTPWLRAVGDKSQAWRYGSGSWQSVADADYQNAYVARNPNFTSNPRLTWDRNDRVTFAVPDLNLGREFTTQFDVNRGKFLLDVPHSIAVFQNDLWVLTAGGLVKFDIKKRWSDVTSLEVSEKGGVRIVSLPGKDLIAIVGGSLLQWNGQKWQEPADAAALTKVLQDYDQHLLQGDFWTVPRATPHKIQVKLGGSPAMQEAFLRPEGLFDFEKINGLSADGTTCICASDFGLVRVDAQSVDVTRLWKQDTPAVHVARRQQDVFARLGSNTTLQYDPGKDFWKIAAQQDVFDGIDATLYEGSGWSWSRQNDRLRVELRQSERGIWREAETIAVSLGRDRFAFDEVYDVGELNAPWLITTAGLLSRHGDGLVAITPPQPFQSPRNGGRALLNITPQDTPRLFAHTADGKLIGLDARSTWSAVATDQVPAIISLSESQEARSICFDASRLKSGGLTVSLHLPDDADNIFKPIDFDESSGLFTFDQFTGLTRQAGPDPTILVGTTGGVARFGVDDSTLPSLHRVFCHPQVDGIGSEPVETVLLGKREVVNMLTTGSGSKQKYYRLENDRWEDSEALAELYRVEKKTIAYDQHGWQVLDRAQESPPPTRGARFDQRWRGQVVRLLNLQKSGDGGNESRFAHDIPLSATVDNRFLWLATRGGVIGFPRRASGENGEFDLAQFTLYSNQTLRPGELNGTEQVKGVSLVRAVGETLYARRPDGTALECKLTEAEISWTEVAADSRSFRDACYVASNSFWSWEKNGLDVDSIRIKIDQERGSFPTDYEWMSGGTLAFLETAHTPRDGPATTMAFYRGHLYLATAGGISRFPEPVDDAVWPSKPHEFIDSVYAVADRGGQNIAMTDIVQLYHDPDDDLLYAQSRTSRAFVFDPEKNTWTVCSTGDPFKKADVVVSNDLLRWTLSGGVWQFDVLPLVADMPDQSDYPLFADGKFAFDKIRSFALLGGHYWLATDGGVCCYDAETFVPKRFYARDFYHENHLAPVCEIATNPVAPSQLLCRTRDGSDAIPFAFENDHWGKLDDAAPLEQAFTRDEDELMKFVQYPDGVLEAHLSGPSAAVLGSGRNPTNPALFSRNRFSFDDVRTAVLDKQMLWSATPAGIVEYELDWTNFAAIRRKIYSAVVPGTAMGPLERIIRLPGNELLAWGNQSIYRAKINADETQLHWQVVGNSSGAGLKDKMILPDSDFFWLLARNSENDDGLSLYRLPHGTTNLTGNERRLSISNQFRSPDASLSLMDEHWIYQPVADGGLMRIRKSDFR